jgi:hypothetical protein
MDADILTLCRPDYSIVARFSSASADLNEIRKAAEQDYSTQCYRRPVIRTSLRLG